VYHQNQDGFAAGFWEISNKNVFLAVSNQQCAISGHACYLAIVV